MALIAPIECQENENVRRYIDRLVETDTPITEHHFVDLRQSMNNGGGPACLRLRVPMSSAAFDAVPDAFKFNEEKYQLLDAWIDKHYREKLCVNDLSDPKLIDETRTALDEYTKLFNLPSIYNFQQ